MRLCGTAAIESILAQVESGIGSQNPNDLISQQINSLKGQYHGRYHDFGQKFIKFKLKTLC